MDCPAFLAACGSALRASPPKAHGTLVTPFHLLLGNAPMSALLSIPPGVSPFQLEPTMWTPPASATKAPEPLPWPKRQHNSPNQVEPFSPSESTSKAALEEPPYSKQKEEMPLHKILSRSFQEVSVGILNWCRKLEESAIGKTASDLTMKPCVTRWMSSGAWSNLLAS